MDQLLQNSSGVYGIKVYLPSSTNFILHKILSILLTTELSCFRETASTLGEFERFSDCSAESTLNVQAIPHSLHKFDINVSLIKN